MSPMIKEGDPPISTDLLEEARRNLSREYGFALGEEDGRTVLFVRAPEPKPDPFHTLEVVSFSVAEGDLVGVEDVFLLGDERVVRVEPGTLRDLVEERREEDPEVAKHLRNRLDRDHDYTVFRHKGARDHLRLGVRVPRERVDDVTDEDRQVLADNLAPILGSAKGREIRAFYLIGDEHARRLAEGELVDIVGPALREAVEGREDPEGPEDEPEIETEPPGGADELDSRPRGPAADGSVSADPDEPRGAEIIDAESPPSSSGASREGSGQQPPGAGLEADDEGGSSPSPQQPPGAHLDTGDPGTGSSGSTQQPPGAGLGSGGPPGLDDIDESEIEDDGGAMFLDSDGSPEEPSSGSPPDPSPEPEGPPEGGPAPDAGPDSPSDAGQGSKPAGSPENDPGTPAAGGTGTSGPEAKRDAPGSGDASGSDDHGFSPDDDGLAGLAGRGSRFDRPEPGNGGDETQEDTADGAGDDVIVAEVDQAPDAEVPSPGDADGAQAGDVGDAGTPGSTGEPAASPPDDEAAAGGTPGGATDAGPGTTGTPGGTAPDAEPSPGGSPGEDPTTSPDPREAADAPASGADPGASPAAQAARRLREAGYEVVEDVEAGGQPFDFAADRAQGKRLLGLAVESLDPDGVEALVEAGRESGADAVLAIPLDVAPGTREAAWGTVVDLLPPEAAASLDL